MPDQNKSAKDSAPRVGFYACHCGVNIASRVDVKALVAFAKELPDVALAKDYQFRLEWLDSKLW